MGKKVRDIIREALERGRDCCGHEPPASWVTNALYDAGAYDIEVPDKGDTDE